MTWYPDLENCDYFGDKHAAKLLSVGWLSSGNAFPKGNVENKVFKKIVHFAQTPLRIHVFRGFHCCELCGNEIEEKLYDSKGKKLESCSHLNIFVPYRDRIFVSPENLPHYIQAHGYKPPDEYLQAIIESPEPGTKELQALVETIGGKEFAVESSNDPINGNAGQA